MHRFVDGMNCSNVKDLSDFFDNGFVLTKTVGRKNGLTAPTGGLRFFFSIVTSLWVIDA